MLSVMSGERPSPAPEQSGKKEPEKRVEHLINGETAADQFALLKGIDPRKKESAKLFSSIDEDAVIDAAQSKPPEEIREKLSKYSLDNRREYWKRKKDPDPWTTWTTKFNGFITSLRESKEKVERDQFEFMRKMLKVKKDKPEEVTAEAFYDTFMSIKDPNGERRGNLDDFGRRIEETNSVDAIGKNIELIKKLARIYGENEPEKIAERYAYAYTNAKHYPGEFSERVKSNYESRNYDTSLWRGLTGENGNGEMRDQAQAGRQDVHQEGAAEQPVIHLRDESGETQAAGREPSQEEHETRPPASAQPRREPPPAERQETRTQADQPTRQPQAPTEGHRESEAPYVIVKDPRTPKRYFKQVPEEEIFGTDTDRQSQQQLKPAGGKEARQEEQADQKETQRGANVTQRDKGGGQQGKEDPIATAVLAGKGEIRQRHKFRVEEPGEVEVFVIFRPDSKAKNQEEVTSEQQRGKPKDKNDQEGGKFAASEENEGAKSGGKKDRQYSQRNTSKRGKEDETGKAAAGKKKSNDEEGDEQQSTIQRLQNKMPSRDVLYRRTKVPAAILTAFGLGLLGYRYRKEIEEGLKKGKDVISKKTTETGDQLSL